MILLPNTTDKISLISSAAGDLDVVCSYAEFNSSFVLSGLGRQVTNITSATTTDILGSPGASTTRNLKQMTCRNVHATVANDVTIQYNANGTLYELHKVTLQPGDMLEFVEGVGFFVLTNFTSGRLITNVESDDTQQIFQSVLPKRFVVTAGTEDFILVSGTAYYVYVGRTAQAITAAFVEFHVTTAGAGAQTAEVGLFSTPSAPSKSAQTLTKIVATGTVDSLTTTGMKRNTSNFAQAVPAGTHLWAAIRTAMATTQPKLWGLGGDYSQGHALTTTGGGALTGLSTASGGLIAIAVNSVCPDVRVTLN